MNNCLNCGEPLKIVEGRRPKLYCDNKGKCKGEYRRKQGKKQHYVSFTSFQELQAKFEAAEKENEQLKHEIVRRVSALQQQHNADVLHKNGLKVHDLPPASRTDENLAVHNEVLNIQLGEDEEQKKQEINDGIYSQIRAIEKEKIPAERNSTIGRKVWQKEQYNRIKELEKLLK